MIHWDERRYDFGLNYEGSVYELKADARASAVADADVVAWLLGPGEAPPPTVLATKSLAPWLNGWQVVVAVRDPAALAETQRSERRRRIIIIGIALLMIVFGTLATIQLIKRELDIARMQTSFAANVSHELRSPITHIRIQGESLMLGLTDTEEEQEEAYVSIVRESERLSRLVDNVLDFAAIEQGAKRYTLRDRDLVGTVLRAVDSISSAQELTDKELDVDLPANLPDVPHDGDAVAQCVINLVSNAAKYSEPGGWIGVRGRRVESGVEITVSDRGIGIAPHDLRRLFDPFFRSRDALARRRKGTGIGLTITRYIMRSHGGDVQVASRPGKGSTFTLRFPLEGSSD
jgi:two-component system phosphate regulon sensor histidine kinase PhoR